MKLLVNLTKKELDKYLQFTNSFIIGLKDYSVNYYEFDCLEIETLLDNYNHWERKSEINSRITCKIS